MDLLCWVSPDERSKRYWIFRDLETWWCSSEGMSCWLWSASEVSKPCWRDKRGRRLRIWLAMPRLRTSAHRAAGPQFFFDRPLGIRRSRLPLRVSRDRTNVVSVVSEQFSADHKRWAGT